jgi:glycolate oxidase FAD binding subunit
MTKTSSIEEELQRAAGDGNLRPSAESDAVCGVPTRLVAEPQTGEQLAAVLSCANRAGLAVLPRGGGTKMNWGNPPQKADLVLSTARLNRILEHAWGDLTVTAEAGCTLRSLESALRERGQRLALDPLWPERATVGGVLSTNDSGALRLRFGALRDLIIGVTLALPDGTLASSGGKVVKNVAGYDLPKLATGAFGTLGAITRAVFRLHPSPRGAKSFSFATRTFQAMQEVIFSIQDSKLAHTALQIRCETGGEPRADILFEATDAGLTAQESQLRNILGSTRCAPGPEGIWNARQDLSSPHPESSVVAKLSVLPARIANSFASLAAIADAEKVTWQIVAQATGIATLRLEGATAALSAAIAKLRAYAESTEGSLVLLCRPAELGKLDAWGNPGDALPLMRAVKHQLDPNSTLNPGRFVGGI